MSEEEQSRSRLTGLILAGGASTRMGAPKPIMPWGDQTFVEAVIQKMKAAGVAPVAVVLGAHFREAQAHCRSLGAQPIHHAQWPLGQFSSLQAGVGERAAAVAPPGTEDEKTEAVNGIMIALVDQPHIAVEVFQEVAKVAARFPGKLIIPSFQGRRGHPYVIPRELIPAVLATPPTSTSREFLTAHQTDQLLVPVNDAGIHFDIDTPEDLLLAQQRYLP